MHPPISPGAARMFSSVGSFAVRRHRLVLSGAAVLYVILAVIAVGAFSRLQSGGQTDPSAPSGQAEALVASHFGGDQNLVVLVTGQHDPANAPKVAAVGAKLTQVLRSDPQASHVSSYWADRVAGLRSTDGRSALVLAHIRGDDNQIDSRVTSLSPRLTALGGNVASVQIGGSAGTNSQLTSQVGSGLLLVSVVAVPITVVLLYFAFASLFAALLPLAVGLLAILGSFAALRVIAGFTSVSTYGIDLTIALGLGLGVDYALLLINRYREELGRGADSSTAVANAVATAGRTIVFSGVTIAAALTALLVFPLYFLRSFAYAGIAVVVFALLGAMFVIPALLAAFGPRVGRGRPKTAQRHGESPFWRRLATAVVHHPLRSALPVVVGLLVIGSPFLGVRFATPDDRALPATAPAHQVGDALRTRFRADPSATLTVVATGTSTTADQADYATRLSKLPNVNTVQGATGTYRHGHRVAPPDSSLRAGNVTYWSLDNHLVPSSTAAASLVGQVRGIGAPAGTTIRVGGSAADLVDQKHSISAALPLAAAIIVLATFLVLFLFTGSVLIPLKALILNGLTLFAAIGAMVWAFQGGHLAGLLSFTPTPTSTTIPPLLFVVAFGLSMDYEVFLLSRIKELHDRGVPNTEAIVSGTARTGRIVTTAAALLSVTFFAFALSKISFLQFFGIGTGIAILLDATCVRGVLVPAAMRLVGEPIWWAPPALRRLHNRIGFTEAPDPSDETSVTPTTPDPGAG
jgi:RND superfamily putative drug exporter